MRKNPVDPGGVVVLRTGGYLMSPVMFLCNGSKVRSDASSVVAVRSIDGYQWSFTTVIARAWDFDSAEGANENDLAYMPDGRIISVLRFGAGYAPWSFYYSAFSSDEGTSFTHPMPMKRLGSCRPKLCLVPTPRIAEVRPARQGGTLLLAGGRVGCDGAHGYPSKDRHDGCALNTSGSDNYVWMNTDGSGQQWQEYSISYHHNNLVKPPAGAKGWRFPESINSTDWDGNATTDYTSLIALDANTIMYSIGNLSAGKCRRVRE
jgi:hypothetical protein